MTIAAANPRHQTCDAGDASADVSVIVDVCVCVLFVSEQNWWLKWKMGGPGPLEPEASGNRGQAGFTPNERRRFADIRKHADLIDPFRLLHGDEVVGKKVRSPPINVHATARRVTAVCS